MVRPTEPAMVRRPSVGQGANPTTPNLNPWYTPPHLPSRNHEIYATGTFVFRSLWEIYCLSAWFHPFKWDQHMLRILDSLASNELHPYSYWLYIYLLPLNLLYILFILFKIKHNLFNHIPFGQLVDVQGIWRHGSGSLRLGWRVFM